MKTLISRLRILIRVFVGSMVLLTPVVSNALDNLTLPGEGYNIYLDAVDDPRARTLSEGIFLPSTRGGLITYYVTCGPATAALETSVMDIPKGQLSTIGIQVTKGTYVSGKKSDLFDGDLKDSEKIRVASGEGTYIVAVTRTFNLADYYKNNTYNVKLACLTATAIDIPLTYNIKF